jgi:hypothetical protein
MDSSTVLGYLEGSVKRRTDHAVSEWRGTLEGSERFEELENATDGLEKAVLPQHRELYTHMLNIKHDESERVREACYRAGWLDGIALGVLAASRSAVER